MNLTFASFQTLFSNEAAQKYTGKKITGASSSRGNGGGGPGPGPGGPRRLGRLVGPGDFQCPPMAGS